MIIGNIMILCKRDMDHAADKLMCLVINDTFVLTKHMVKLQKRDKYGYTLAHHLAFKGHMFPEHNLKILSLKGDNGWTVAHAMTSNGFIFHTDNEVLHLKDLGGCTVLNEMVTVQQFKSYDLETSHKNTPIGVLA